MVQVIWSPEAAAQLDAVHSYISLFDTRAADRLARRLKAAGDSLTVSPRRGRSGRQGTRELPSVRPYVIVYEVQDDLVLILSIRHGRQRPPED